MSRTVAVHSDSVAVVYIDGGDIDEDFLWQDFTEDLESLIVDNYPSFEQIDSWNGREVHEILSNKHTVISVSEYMGLISVSISVNEDASDYLYWELAKSWTERHAPKIAKLIENNFNSLRRVGMFSNGEGVYERIANATI